ncbi:hypothetical protein EDD30_7723 [Couchioplanes caeruleus]|uniref:Uncharacterized protein n=1 Tax=Couchioplanes caeruleus TaxID=56438 RepID=A0A3N1FTS6_9ACTN|nr:hypothetical protein EDD30_7723 [Couchioplanes caeruleus]
MPRRINWNTVIRVMYAFAANTASAAALITSLNG